MSARCVRPMLVAWLSAVCACSAIEAYPGGDERELEACHDGLDNDHDGLTDCDDTGCAELCVERSAALCDDGIDDDLDGLVDCGDPSCAAHCPAAPAAPELSFVDADGTPRSPAAPPVLTPCPAGWGEVTSASGVVRCEPWPGDARPDCPAGQVAWPGSVSCVPVGGDCPAPGEFPEPVSANPVYVRAGATGGDGSRAAPLGSVVDALAAITPGQTEIVLASGDYDVGTLRLTRALELTGACASGTRLRGGIELSGLVVSVRGLTLGGGEGPALLAVEGAELTLDGVLIEGGVGVGVQVVDSSVSLEDVAIRDTEPAPFTQQGGQGVWLVRSPASLGHVSLEGNVGAGLEAVGRPSLMSATDLVVWGTRRSMSSGRGEGVYLHDGAGLTATTLVTGRNAHADVFVVDHGSLRVVTGYLLGGGEEAHGPVFVDGGASAALTGSYVGAGAVFSATVDVATLKLTDSLVEGPRAGLAFPALTLTGRGGVMELTRVVFDRRASRELSVTAEATLTAEDVELIDADGLGGRALWVREGAHVSLERARLTQGILLDGAQESVQRTRVELADVWIDSPPGPGVVAVDDAELSADGLLVTGASKAGVSSRAADLDLTDLEVRGVATDDVRCSRGVDFTDGRLSLRRGRVSGVEEAGVVVTAGDASLRDLSVSLGSRPCLDTCSGPDAASRGVGVARYAPGADPLPLTLTDVRVELAGACALQLEPGATDALLRVEARDTGAALCRLGPDDGPVDGVLATDGVAASRGEVSALPGCAPTSPSE